MSNYKHGFAPKHGKRNRIYKCWCKIRQNCFNSNSIGYQKYGAKGVSISDEWSDFVNFYNWSIENGYSDEKYLTRIDDNEDYCPSNCMWAEKIRKDNKKHIDIKNESIDGEIWKPINGYVGIYEASNLGRIRSVDRYVDRSDGSKVFKRGKVLKQGTDRGGYKFVILHNNSKRCRLVHRIVAETFIYCNKHDLQINHIDGNKTNNAVSNLEYCTCAENIHHAIKTGLINNTKEVVACDPRSGEEVMRFKSVEEAKKHFVETGGTNISNALNGRCKTAYGYAWRYGACA